MVDNPNHRIVLTAQIPQNGANAKSSEGYKFAPLPLLLTPLPDMEVTAQPQVSAERQNSQQQQASTAKHNGSHQQPSTIEGLLTTLNTPQASLKEKTEAVKDLKTMLHEKYGINFHDTRKNWDGSTQPHSTQVGRTDYVREQDGSRVTNSTRMDQLKDNEFSQIAGKVAFALRDAVKGKLSDAQYTTIQETLSYGNTLNGSLLSSTYNNNFNTNQAHIDKLSSGQSGGYTR